MRPEERDVALLWDMLDAAKAVREFVAGKSFAHYERDRMLRGAVERNIEIIGVAAGRVSMSFREAHPDIPWVRIVGQRNVIAHEYGEIKNEAIWKVATHYLVDLIAVLEPIVASAERESES